MRSPAHVLLVTVLLSASGCLSGAPSASTPRPTSSVHLGGVDAAAIPVGIQAIVHSSDGTILPAAAFPGVLPVMAQRDLVNRPAGEPTVAVTSKDVAILNSIAFDATGIRDAPADLPLTALFRTSDKGASWTDVTPRVGPVNAPPTTEDPYVHADPVTDRIFSAELLIGCVWVSFSDDAGASWKSDPVACEPPMDHQTLWTGKPVGVSTLGYPNVVYLCVNQFVASVVCMRSLDGGQTFLPGRPVYVEPKGDNRFVPGDCGFVAHGHGASSPVDGTAYLPHVYCNQALIEVSRDGGVSWERVVVDGTLGSTRDEIDNHEGNVAVDAAGNVYYVWTARDGLPYLSVSRDQGRHWDAPKRVSVPGVTAARFATLAAGDEGRIAVFYLGSNVTGGLAAPPEGKKTAEWHAYVGFTLDALAAAPVFATTTINPITDPLRRGACDVRCGEGSDIMFDFMDLQMQPKSGEVWAALVDVCRGECARPGSTVTTPGGDIGALGVQLAGPSLRINPR